MIQLARNSVVHGVESPGARAAAKKDPRATLTIRALDRPNEFGFTFRDDGRGLDLTRIRDCALAKRSIATDAAAKMTGEQIIALIFEPGFSTASEASANSGRGTGMSVLRRRILDECDGNVAVVSESGRYCEFEIVIPLRAMVLA